MKALSFWFDPISPYAYLAFEHLPQALEGCSYMVEYRPVLFAGLLGQWGQKGPAEIEPKRAWTFRQAAWLAHNLGIELATPTQHPFNPLALLRLGLASAPASGQPNRRVVELLMRHVWRGGADANDADRLRALRQAVAPQRDPASEEVKAELRSQTGLAIERGVFGVPTIELDGRLFWGLDALPMVRAALLGDAWFDGPAWDAAGTAPPGLRRRT
ncbi:MAG TPA: 2-hydroxychromene-2-carboxylate isomerase [Rubrivivax sp.]|nr:2-hydroxychromene-2-carboxylate isomerase [Rubrivivax sp.]